MSLLRAGALGVVGLGAWALGSDDVAYAPPAQEVTATSINEEVLGTASSSASFGLQSTGINQSALGAVTRSAQISLSPGSLTGTLGTQTVHATRGLSPSSAATGATLGSPSHTATFSLSPAGVGGAGAGAASVAASVSFSTSGFYLGALGAPQALAVCYVTAAGGAGATGTPSATAAAAIDPVGFTSELLGASRPHALAWVQPRAVQEEAYGSVSFTAQASLELTGLYGELTGTCRASSLASVTAPALGDEELGSVELTAARSLLFEGLDEGYVEDPSFLTAGNITPFGVHAFSEGELSFSTSVTVGLPGENFELVASPVARSLYSVTANGFTEEAVSTPSCTASRELQVSGLVAFASGSQRLRAFAEVGAVGFSGTTFGNLQVAIDQELVLLGDSWGAVGSPGAYSMFPLSAPSVNETQFGELWFFAYSSRPFIGEPSVQLGLLGQIQCAPRAQGALACALPTAATAAIIRPLGAVWATYAHPSGLLALTPTLQGHLAEAPTIEGELRR